MLAAYVLLLLSGLGHDEFTVRCAAQRQLNAILCAEGSEQFLPLVQSAVGSADAEVAARARKALAVYADVRPTSYPRIPWIDSLAEDFPDRWLVVQQCLDAVGRLDEMGRQPPNFADYRAATLILVNRLLSQGQTRTQVRAILDAMVPEDLRQRKQYGLSSP